MTKDSSAYHDERGGDVISGSASGRGFRPLENVRVIDSATFISGAFAGMILADLGADVIKVEPPPTGDPYRYLGRRYRGTAVSARLVNRGKRSVQLDLKSPLDRDRFLDLLEGADIFLENWRPGVFERLVLDPGGVDDRLSRLVHLSVTGYGPTGPWASLPAFDALIQGVTGMASINTYDGRPHLLPTYLADKVPSIMAALTVVSLLRERDRTGRGCRCDMPMLEANAYFNFPDVMESNAINAPDRDPDVPPPSSTVQSIVRTSTGWLVLSPSTGDQLAALCAVVGHAEWWDEIRGLKGYSAVVAALVERVEPITSQAPTDHWLELCTGAGIPVAPVLSPAEHLANPQVVARRLYQELDDPALGRVRWARYPATLRDGTTTINQESTRPAPDVGADTDEVLGEC